MRKIFFILIFVLVSTIKIWAQNTLTIEIQNLRSGKGQILLSLLNDSQEKVKGAYGKIENNKCTIIFENLNKGNYAFRYFHDENNNDKLDSNWMGIPKEGYGFSNNARVTFGPPSFNEWLFPLNKNTKMVCMPKY
ncbi:MAG TPA: DUF2141 domain-containing protein [Bacteroidales bacterium]|nr:DUF2141 domain-containing protein [Bacteroidales bacterium]